MELDQSEYDMGSNADAGKAERIAEELENEIRVGKLKEGSRVPSERELSERFQVSRMTTRKALEILAGEGLVMRYPVRGTFVGSIRQRLQVHHGSESYPPSDPSTVTAEELQRSGSFIKDMKLLGHKPKVRFLEQPALVAADEEVASQLALPNDLLVLKRYRVQLADGLPYRLIESYYPADLFSEVLRIELGDKPLFEWLQETQGLQVVHAQENLIARLASKEEQQLLQISSQAPVVAFARKVWANNGRVVEWASIIAVAALYGFSYEYDIPSKNFHQAMNEDYEQQNGVRM